MLFSIHITFFIILDVLTIIPVNSLLDFLEVIDSTEIYIVLVGFFREATDKLYTKRDPQDLFTQ